MALIVRGSRWRWLLGGLAVIYALGVVAAAEFSTLIGLLVAVVVIVILTKSSRIVAYAIPVAAIGAVLLWPVIQIRLSEFQSASGLPSSWLVRLYNLRTYFWPTLFSDFNWVLGVRPSAREVVPTTEYGYVWIESGYTWLLWGGGVPLLASYLAFATASIRKGWPVRAARRCGRGGGRGSCRHHLRADGGHAVRSASDLPGLGRHDLHALGPGPSAPRRRRARRPAVPP